MKFWDRLLRSLFVGAGVGLGWGIRGDFGHAIGAMAPGATLGMAFVYVTGQRSLMKWMPIFAAAGAFFISFGGLMSYAHLHGYGKSDTFVNYSFGLFCLILQGGTWGGFAGAALGLLMEKERVKVGEVLGAAMTSFATGWLFYTLIVDVIGWDINPPRDNASIAFFGRIVGLFIWMIVNKRWTGLRGLSLGFVGFGLGMSLGRIADNAIIHMNADAVQASLGIDIHQGFFHGRIPWFGINNWNVMETGCGLLGGLIFTFGMLGRPLPDPPQEGEGWSAVSFWGIVYVMGFIPLLHFLTRIEPNALTDWANRFVAGGFDADSAKKYATWTLYGLDGVVVTGFAAALIWIILWKKDLVRWAWFPVLAFSLLMLLFQNLTCVYIAEKKAAEHYVNMHTVFWCLFGFMVLFTLAFELVWPRRDALDAPEKQERLPWVRWVVTTLVLYVAMVGTAHFTNDKLTMTSANMRWPLWSWKAESPRTVLEYERRRHVKLPPAIRGNPEKALRGRAFQGSGE